MQATESGQRQSRIADDGAGPPGYGPIQGSHLHDFDATLATEGEKDPVDENEILINIINRFVGLHSRDAQRESTNDSASEYPFVAMDTRQVLAQVAFVANTLGLDPENPPPAPPRFLDIGCGIGNVLLIAEQFGFSVYGIEKDPYPCGIARRLIGDERILEEDIWSWNGYGDFEVVYYFRPFSERERQLRFERLIEETIRKGAILVANHKNSDGINEDRRFVRLHPSLPIWRKH